VSSAMAHVGNVIITKRLAFEWLEALTSQARPKKILVRRNDRC
jgi:hypothetical protein